MVMHQQVYHSQAIQAWERRWFEQQNSSFGLMQQVAWLITQRLNDVFRKSQIQTIAIWCGAGNNAGDGYCIAVYLQQLGYQVEIYATEAGNSLDLNLAVQFAHKNKLKIHPHFHVSKVFDCHIDALFGIGLNRLLSVSWQNTIHQFNRQSGLKISIDIPSGLNANTGQPLPCAIKAEHTYTVLGLKAGLYTGQGKEYSGQIDIISAIPADDELQPLALLSPKNIHLPQRQAFGHKGSYGHVLVVGGHADMGGAVIMAAESAFTAGAGKVSIVCDVKHHTAILARAPNIMIRDINVFDESNIQDLLNQVDAVCFGMGLGRDDWSKRQYLQWFPKLNTASHLHVVLDADALWFLAQQPELLNVHTYATPHPGEAAKLLGLSIKDIEDNRIQAIHQLKQRYAGQWVLKGAGSLVLEEQQLWMCTAGNAGMGTGGMGDVLAGMIASFKAQLNSEIQLHEIVTLHALAGDYLAQKGQRGLQAHHMSNAVYVVVNQLGANDEYS